MKRKKSSLKKPIFTLATCGVMLASSFALIGCSGEMGGGTNWYRGTADVNTITEGKAGDFYIDTDDYILYQKNADGTWSIVMENFGKNGEAGTAGTNGTNGTNGTDGATWTTGTLNPLEDTVDGKEGDLYLNTSTQNIYRKGATNWALIGNIKGATGATGATGSAGSDGAVWLTGTQNPTEDDVEGNVGDLYLNTTTQNLYQKGESGWALLCNIKGTAGTNGIAWIAGTYNPNDVNQPGNDGDFFLNLNNNDLYRKTADNWMLICNIKGETGEEGTDGTAWFTGEQNPDDVNGLAGKEGDLYLNTTTQNLYQKGESGWTLLCNTKGETGSAGKGIQSIESRYDYNEEGKLCFVLTITYTEGEPEEVWSVVPAKVTSAYPENGSYDLYTQSTDDTGVVEGFTLCVGYDDGSSESNVAVTRDMLFDVETGELVDCTVDGICQVQVKLNGYVVGEYQLYVYNPENVSIDSATVYDIENQLDYLYVFDEKPESLNVRIYNTISTGGYFVTDAVISTDDIITELSDDFFTTAGTKTFDATYNGSTIKVLIELYNEEHNVRYCWLEGNENLVITERIDVVESDENSTYSWLFEKLVNKNLSVQYYQGCYDADVGDNVYYEDFTIEQDNIITDSLTSLEEFGEYEVQITTPLGNTIGITLLILPAESDLTNTYCDTDGFNFGYIEIYNSAEGTKGVIYDYDGNVDSIHDVNILTESPDFTTDDATIDISLVIDGITHYFTLTNSTDNGNSICATILDEDEEGTTYLCEFGDSNNLYIYSLTRYSDGKAMFCWLYGEDTPDEDDDEVIVMYTFDLEESTTSFNLYGITIELNNDDRTFTINND